jgi:hypothetical protein
MNQSPRHVDGAPGLLQALGAHTFNFFKLPLEMQRFLKHQFLLYQKGPHDLQDLATFRLQTYLRDAVVCCVPYPRS